MPQSVPLYQALNEEDSVGDENQQFDSSEYVIKDEATESVRWQLLHLNMQ